jgi:hypothetical protein
MKTGFIIGDFLGKISVSYLPSFHHGLHRILSFIFNFVHIAFDVIIPLLSKQESAVVRIEFIEGREITLVWKGRQPIYVNKSLNHHKKK